MNIHTQPEIVSLEKAFVFGGSYGNLQATEAMLKKAHELGFSTNEILFTGDSVAYCGEPEETVRLLMDAGICAIAGNCEEALVTGSSDCGCGFEEGTQCDLLSAQWYAFCQRNTSKEAVDWMGTLPQQMVARIAGKLFLITHAVPGSSNTFVFPSNYKTSFDILSGNVDGYIVGHSGIPFVGEHEGKLWINSGAAGMPANDGTDRVWYSTITAEKNGIIAQTHALRYEAQLARTAMLSNGLENGYADCLMTGLWPSLDVLPKQEKSQTGHPLFPSVRKIKNEILIA